jgi:putative thioredoxin
MNETPHQSPWIVEADDASFQQIAVERSRSTLVVVDFWAAWCQPCRMLGPLLEKLAAEYDGKFLLVKVDTETAPNIAAGFGVQSIPAVFALRDGQLIDYFVGLLPEGQLRSWLDRQLPTAAEQLVAEASLLEATDPTTAQAKYREAARLDANLAPARIGLASLLLRQGQLGAARALLEELEARGFLEPEAERLQAELHLAGAAEHSGDLAALRAAVSAQPTDLAAQLALAEALAAQRQFEEALELALAIVQTHNKQFAEPARKLMVDLFRVLPEESPLVSDFRRRLSTALY